MKARRNMVAIQGISRGRVCRGEIFMKARRNMVAIRGISNSRVCRGMGILTKRDSRKLDFFEKSNKFRGRNRSHRGIGGRFCELVVENFIQRISLRNFAVVNSLLWIFLKIEPSSDMWTY